LAENSFRAAARIRPRVRSGFRELEDATRARVLFSEATSNQTDTREREKCQAVPWRGVRVKVPSIVTNRRQVANRPLGRSNARNITVR
jgi:hypothetical protein